MTDQSIGGLYATLRAVAKEVTNLRGDHKALDGKLDEVEERLRVRLRSVEQRQYVLMILVLLLWTLTDPRIISAASSVLK